MKKIRLAALLLPLLLLTTYAQAQTWALPAPNQQLKDVPCSTCPAAVKDKPTIGYSGAIKGFVGRFLDSQSTLDRQAPLRTARADGIYYAPQRGRVYVRMGSAIFGYDYATFFSKLSSGQSMISAREVLSSGRQATATENFLAFDNFFNAEYTDSGWNTPTQDGQERLYDFDYDDRDLIYLTTKSYFGWGIIRDNRLGGRATMPSITQVYPAGAPDISRLAVMKSNGGYYMIGSDSQASTSQLWDVSTPNQPRRLGDYPRPFVSIARSSDMSRVAMLEPNGALVIHAASAILNGAQPYGTYRGTTTAFRDVTSDGTNFYATSAGPGFTLSVTEFLYNAASSTYSIKEINVGGVMIPDTITANAGYLVITGTSSVGTDMRVLKIGSDFSLADLPLNNYVAKYYTSPPPGYVAPGPFIQMRSGVVLQQGSNLYLAVNAHALGDVYLLEGTVTSTPPPVTPLPTTPTPTVPTPTVPTPTVPTPTTPTPTTPTPTTPTGCFPIDLNHVSYDYSNQNLSCTASGSTSVCRSSDVINFDVIGFAGYNFNCSSHSYLWTLSDGSTIGTKTFSRTFPAGNHNITLRVSNGTGDSHTFAFTLPIVSGTGATPTPLPTTPTPTVPTVPVPQQPVPQPTGCGILSNSTASYDWYNASKSCGAIGATCGINDPLTFDVEFFGGYNPTKCTNSYLWTLDGQTYTTKSFTKTFTAAGSYAGHVTVNNGGGVPYDVAFTVQISGSGPTTPTPVTPNPPNPPTTPVGSCGTMNSNTVLVKYTGPSSGCNELGGNCQTSEAVSFNAKDVHPGYDFSCGVHKFTWNFGDGTPAVVAGMVVSHPYTTPGSYPVTLKVEQGSAFFIAATVVKVTPAGSGGTPISNFDFSVAPYAIGGTYFANGYVFTPFAEPTVDNVVWTWNFGDGSPDVTSTDYKGVSHIYADSNDHIVTLTSPQGDKRTHTLKLRRRPGR